MSESPLAGKRMAVIGCGNMSTAIVGGLVDRDLIAAEMITGADKDPARRDALADLWGIRPADSNAQAIEGADIVLLGVKPQNAEAVMSEIGAALSAAQLVVSIMAGITTAYLEGRATAPVPVVRVMPNTPALVGCGAAALAPGKQASDEHLALARAIFEAVGVAVELEEEHLDAVTALSGSGPGFIFFLLEAMIQAGMDVGLSPRIAHTLAAQTLLGAARLLHEDGQGRSPAELREAVTSPGGTTAAGLEVLRHEKVAEGIRMAIHAATERSRELGRG